MPVMTFTRAGQWGPEGLIDAAGDAQVGAPVALYLADGTTLATRYTDATKATPAANPWTSDSIGNVTLFADPGQYVLKVTIGGLVTPLPIEVPVDPSEAALDADVALHTAATTGVHGVGASTVESVAGAAAKAAAALGEAEAYTEAVDGTALHKSGASQATSADTDFTAGLTHNAHAVVDTTDARLSDVRVPSGPAGGDLAGTYPNPALAAAGPGAAGPLGDATHVAVVTTDAKGRVVALTSAAIALPESAVTSLVADLAAKAADNTVVHTTGNETATGAKSLDQVRTKTGPVYDVTHPFWGADPTGVGDSTAAIQNAMNAANAAGGGTVFLPAGTFKVSWTANSWCLLPKSNVRIQGAGRYATTIKRADNQVANLDVRIIGTPGFSTLGYTTPVSGFEVLDVGFDGNSAGNTDAAYHALHPSAHVADHYHTIFLSAVTDCLIERCLFKNSPGDHVQFQGAATAVCLRNRILNNTLVTANRVPLNIYGLCESLVSGNVVYGQAQNWCCKMEMDANNKARWGNVITDNLFLGYSGLSISGRQTTVILNANTAIGATTVATPGGVDYTDGVPTDNGNGTSNLESDTALFLTGGPSVVGLTIIGDNIPGGTTILAVVDDQNATTSNVIAPNGDGSPTTFTIVNRSGGVVNSPTVGQPIVIGTELAWVSAVDTGVLPYVITLQRPLQQAHTAGEIIRLGYITDTIIANNRFRLGTSDTAGGGGDGISLAGMQRVVVSGNDISGGNGHSINVLRDVQNANIEKNTLTNLTGPGTATGAINVGGGATSSGTMQAISDIAILFNTIIGAPQYGIQVIKTATTVLNVSRARIRGNTIISSLLAGIILNGVDDSEVDDNTIIDCGASGLNAGIRFANTAQSRISTSRNYFGGTPNQTIGIRFDGNGVVADASFSQNRFSNTATPVQNPTFPTGNSYGMLNRSLNGSGAIPIIGTGTGEIQGGLSVLGNLTASALVAKIKAGTLADGDFTTPADGEWAFNSSKGWLEYRSGGTWHTTASELAPTVTYAGPLATGVLAAKYTVERAGTIGTVRVSLGTAPGTTSVIVDVLKNGTSIYNVTPANRPTIAAGATTAVGGTPDTTTFAASDVFTFQIVQVGTSPNFGDTLTITPHLLAA